MSPPPNDYRCESDRALAKELAEHDDVRPIMRALAEKDRALGTRRSLLAQALRLTPIIAPSLHAILDRCREYLAVEAEVELYVYGSAQFNAACTAPEGERVFVLLSSALAEAFADDELAFVVGHELGHHVYDHHALPVQVLTDPQHELRPSLILRLLSWQRYAEISADRAGLLCAQGLEPAARALFKLSSGLSGSPTEEQVRAYLAQAQELYAEAERVEAPGVHRDWLSTHPFSPVRLSAAQAFTDSAVMNQGGMPLDQLERAVHGFMALMEASYLEEDSAEAEAMRRVLFAGGVMVAAADGELEQAELDVLIEQLGHGRVPANINVEALREHLASRVTRCNEVVRPSRRAQLLRDLALIARADGRVDTAERTFMLELSQQLGVDGDVVTHALTAPLELD